MKSLTQLNIKTKKALFYRLNLNEKLVAGLVKSPQDYYKKIDLEIGLKNLKLKSKPANIKLRPIYIASPELGIVQKKINKLLCTIPLSENFQGGIKNRSIKTNAIKHIKKRYVANFDIENFYPSITKKQVFHIFHKDLGCSPDIAEILTDLTTADNQLPQGFCTSPRLAILRLASFEVRIRKLLEPLGYQYSFWVDDLTVSGNKNIKRIEPLIRRIAQQNKLQLHSRSKKFQIRNSQQRQTVTGLVVNRDLSVPKELQKELKSIIAICEKHGVKNYLNEYQPHLSKEKFETSLRGTIQSLASVNHKYNKLLSRFNRLTESH